MHLLEEVTFQVGKCARAESPSNQLKVIPLCADLTSLLYVKSEKEFKIF